MATYWTIYENKWHEISDDVNLEKFAHMKLQEHAYRDSDNGYWVSIVFYRDGVYTYGFAEYDSYSGLYNLCGEMNTFAYGTLEHIHNIGSDWCKTVEATSLLAPDRDWIVIK